MTLDNDKETYSIIGAAMNVHNELGTGFLEAVYQEALEIELKKLDIPFSREEEIPLFYKGEKLKKYYIADFICYNKIVVELKALQNISNTELSQVINYLKATNLKRGLILNFGNISLQHKRVVVNY